MKRIKTPMFRYGEADWDRQYMQWGFHNEDTQIAEAESVLRLVDLSKPLHILDVACGLGTHAVYWAEHGHSVKAIDISSTFTAEGEKRAREKGVKVDFMISDVHAIELDNCIDVAVWIEKALYDEASVAAIYRSLVDGGLFIQDIRNPDHPRTRAVTGNWERWSEHDGLFKLERHSDDENGIHHDIWIDIDTVSGSITERTSQCKAGGQNEVFRTLEKVGFSEINIRTMEGDIFQGGAEPQWLWVIARKGGKPST